MKCSIFKALSVVYLLVSPLVPGVQAQTADAASAAQQRMTLRQVLQAANHNLDVALARITLAAAQSDIAAADHAPLPSLSAKIGSIDLQNGIGAGNILYGKRVDKGIGIDWTWERGNKRKLRVAAAQRSAQAAQADVQDVQSQQMLTAATAYFDLSSAQERVAQVQAIAAATAQISATAARRLQAGDTSRQEVLRLEIESQRAQADVLTALNDRSRANLALAQLLGMSQSTTLVADPLEQSPQTTQEVDTAAWARIEQQIEQRADVRAAQERVAAARAALESANAQKKSDITWGASFDHYPGTSNRLVELRMQIPLQLGYQYQGEIARAQTQIDAAEISLDKTRRSALIEMQKLNAEATSTAQRQQVYLREILPRAQTVAQQAEFAYSKGAMALTDLIDARRTLRTTQLEALAARADHAKAALALQIRSQAIDSFL